MKIYKSLIIGHLPVEMISPILKEELLPGAAYLSARAHEHIALDHPDDYDFCIRNIKQAIEEPTYIGKAPWHIRNFEMVRMVEEQNMLVAIGIEPNAFGNYNIRSAYRLTYEQVRERLHNRHLSWPKKKKPPV